MIADAEGVNQTISLGSGLDLSLRVDALRQTPTGTHGVVTILAGTNYLIHSAFNIDRDEDRTRLANAAHAKLGPVDATGYEKPDFKADLDVFCRYSWKAWVTGQVPSAWTAPATERRAVERLSPITVRGGGTILFAPPKSAKTFVSLALALSIQYGITALWPVKQANVLYINLERDEAQMRQRLLALGEILGTADLNMLHRRGRSLADVEETARVMIERDSVEVLMVDSLSRAGVGDLNENQPMNRAMDTMNRLCPTWHLVAHTPRADIEHAYGSIMADAAADVLVQLVSQREQRHTLGVGLNITSANDLEPGLVGSYALEFDPQLGLAGFRPARHGEFPEIEGVERVPLRQAVNDYLTTNGASSATTIATAINRRRDQVARLLTTSNEYTRAGKEGKEILYAVAAPHWVEG